MMFGTGKAKRTQRHVVTTPDGRRVEFQTPFDAPRSDILSAAQNALGQQFGGERFAQPVYGGSITEYKPGIGSRVQNSLSDALAALGVDRYRANQFGRRAFSFLDDLTPLGDVTTAGNALSAFQRGQPIHGLGLTALAALGVVPGMGDAAAKAVKELDPWERAAKLREGLAARGVTVGPVKTSTNRFGEKSAYIDSPFGELRISDHDANMDFRPGQVQVFTDDPDKLLSDFEESRRRRAAQEAAEKAAIDAKEAPFRRRFANASENERHAIILEAYPWMAHDKAARQALRRKWLGQK